ncbi:MAG: MFS transporter [Armatimonadetes bacterium]|nr:MAG: MFS transporter [Armatimonadota bacterium]
MKLNLLDKRLVTILLIVFVQMVGAGMILPILPLYAKNEFSMSATTVTLLVAAFYAAQFVGGPILGRWSDHVGRVPVLIVSQIGTVIAFIGFGIAWAPWVLFASRIFDGLTGGNIVVAQAYVTDITPREKRAQALGLISAMFGLGFFVGPAVGGLLVGLGPQVPYFVAAAAAAVVVLLTVFTLDESMTQSEREAIRASAVKLPIRDALRIRALTLSATVVFLVQFALGLIIATFALFGEDVLFDTNPELGVGLLLGFVGLSQIITQTAILPNVLRWVGEEVSVVVGIVVRSIGLAIYAVTVSPILAIAGGVFFAMGGGLVLPPIQSIATKSVDDSKRGGLLGVVQSVSSLAIIVSTATAGLIYAVYPHLPNRVALVTSILSMIPAVMLVKRATATRTEEDTWVPSGS